MKLIKIGATMAIACVACACAAQSVDLSPTSAGKQMAGEFQRVCPDMIKQFTGMTELEPALTKRPIKIKEVCSCTEGEFSSDKRLQEFLTADPLALQQRLQSQHLKSYVILRWMQSVMSCVSADMELSLRATSPAQ